MAKPSRAVPFPYVASVVNGGVEVYYPGYPAAQFDGGYASVWPQPLVAPWRYAPDPYCQPPVCLPSYWRPITLAGANYSIDASNQHGKPVRLIVNAGTGQIRRILP